MRTREARVAECVIVTVAASHKGRATLKAQTTGRLAILLAGEQINDILTIQADALVNAAVQHCLTEHREILCVRIQTCMTCNTAVCHPCVAIVALADQRVIAPAIEFAEGIQIGGAIVAEARMTDLIDHSILIRVAERSCCKIIGGKAVFQRQIGRTLEVQRLVDFVLNVLVHIAARDTLHEEAQHLETEVAVLFLTGCEHQFTVADIIQHLGFVLINVQEHSFPLRKTRSMGQKLMNGDILFAILRKFRDVACYGRIEVDLSFAVQLHDGLGRGHDLRAGCHIEHGVHLHGTGIIQPNAHVVQHCISIGFFIDDLTTARHNDDLGTKSYCYGGGHYRRGHMKNALVGTTLEGAKIVPVLPPDDSSIDYHFELQQNCPVSAAAVMAFRTQFFVTRSRVAVVKGLSEGKPELAGLYSALGDPARE